MGAWRGQKAEMLKFHWFLCVFLRSTDGAKRDRDIPRDDRDIPREGEGGHFAYLCVILRLLWASEACFGVIMLHFQKTLISQIEFNDFIIIWDHLEATLGNFWVTLGVTLGV